MYDFLRHDHRRCGTFLPNGLSRLSPTLSFTDIHIPGFLPHLVSVSDSSTSRRIALPGHPTQFGTFFMAKSGSFPQVQLCVRYVHESASDEAGRDEALRSDVAFLQVVRE